MKKLLLKTHVAVISLIVIAILLTLSVPVYATRETNTRFYGMVKLDNANVPLNSMITGRLDGLSWSTKVYYKSGYTRYYLDVPMDTGSGTKDGGVNGDLVYFTLTVNGVDYDDPNPGVWKKSTNVAHSIKLFTPPPTDLVITTTSPLEDGTVGVSYTEKQLEASGGIGPYSWTGTDLPPGLEVSVSGIVSGTPTTAGEYSSNFTVKDSDSPQNTASKILEVKVVKLNDLNFSPNTLEDGVVGVTYSQQLTGTGGTPPYTWSIEGQPAGIAIDDDGLISGTPEAAGKFTVVVTLKDTDSPQNEVSKTYIITIKKLGDYDGDGHVDTKESTRITYIFLGFDTDPYTLEPLPEYTPVLDINKDGKVNLIDAVLIQLLPDWENP